MDSEPKTTKLPSWKNALDHLRELGLIDYGKMIPWPVLEEGLGYKREEGWEFRAEYIELVDGLNCEGFILSERGTNGEGVRILNREEMAEWVRASEFRKAHNSVKNSLILGVANKDGMTDDEKKKMDYWQEKAARNGIAALTLLRARQLPASPDMKRDKSIT